MSYQELVNRMLAVRHAGLEMGLAKAREQQPFIESVARVLDKTSWAYRVRMDRDFNVVFVLDTGKVSLANQYQAVKQALLARFEVDFGALAECGRLDVYCRRSGYGCQVLFGDCDGF